jgi:hypothetical protein
MITFQALQPTSTAGENPAIPVISSALLLQFMSPILALAAARLGATNGTILDPKSDILFIPDVVLARTKP